MEEGSNVCYGPGSVAGAVIGTFFATILLHAVIFLFYRQWKRHKGNHLVLVTDPEIVEDAYAFDNPCFKDATPAVSGRNEKTLSTILVETSSSKDNSKWASPWSSLGIGSANKNDKRKTLDDSCLGPNATRVCIVSLKSRDFTGLGFNVCGNMREGIFVKDLLHRGPASESGRIHPGDRILSVKISFRNMVYEDALTILSYASPYDVELEVESGGSSSRPTTLLKKNHGPTPNRICHPLYRSQSIPELTDVNKTIAKRLFIADPNESINSDIYYPMNSTLKSTKSIPNNRTLDNNNKDAKLNSHSKFGIKVLPALDGTVFRIENQNEHNTNLERHNSRKNNDDDDGGGDNIHEKIKKNTNIVSSTPLNNDKIINERLRQRENLQLKMGNGIDVTDNNNKNIDDKVVVVPSDVPTEVHNAAIAARRNRKNSGELLKSPKLTLSTENLDLDDKKSPSPQKGKRKAPAPPGISGEVKDNDAISIKSQVSLSSKTNSSNNNNNISSISSSSNCCSSSSNNNNNNEKENTDDKIESITDYTESLSDYVDKVREVVSESKDKPRKLNDHPTETGHNYESDTDNEMQHSLTTIELNPADITIHHTPIPRSSNNVAKDEDDDDDDDDVYRKAASLGDLSKYEAKSLATLERAQSLDMTSETSSKKRKAPLPPDDINESTEDLTKLDDIEIFDKRKLKKSNEWGTLEDAFWGQDNKNDIDNKPQVRKKSNGTLERSKSSVEIKLKQDNLSSPTVINQKYSSPNSTNAINENEDGSIELYNLPLSKQLTEEFIHGERMFNPDEDNSLARIVNNGEVIKSPTLDEIELNFKQSKPLDSPNSDEEKNYLPPSPISSSSSSPPPPPPPPLPPIVSESFIKARNLFDLNVNKPTNEKEYNIDKLTMYLGKEEVIEEPMKRVVLNFICPDCEKGGYHKLCNNHSHIINGDIDLSNNKSINKDDDEKLKDDNFTNIEKQIEPMTSFKIESSIKNNNIEEDVDDGCDLNSSVTLNNKNLSLPTIINRHNVSNVSVSSGENSEDSGLVGGESGEFNQKDIDNIKTTNSTLINFQPSSQESKTKKMTYITEIKVSPSREIKIEKNQEQVKPPRNENGKPIPGKKPPVPPRRTDSSKSNKDNSSNDKQQQQQIVYVSEFKTLPEKVKSTIDNNITETKSLTNKKNDHWIYLNENKDQNPWGNGSNNQSQSVTNIVVASTDENIHQK